MMKISCEIIRDILPLYAEGMASPATKEMVEQHLADCVPCRKELEELKKPAPMPVQVATKSLKRVGDSIRRRRILAVGAVFFFIATLILGGALLLDAKIYMTANEAVEKIYQDGDEVVIHWNDEIIGVSSSDGTDNYGVTAWSNLYKRWFWDERVPYEQLSTEIKEMISKEQYESMSNISRYSVKEDLSEANFIYVNPSDNSMTLILNGGNPFPEAPVMDVYSTTLYYCIGMLFLSIVLFLVGRLNREHWYGELAMRLSVVVFSLAASAVVVTAGQFRGLENDFREAFIDSTAVAAPMTLFGLFLRQLIQLNRKDRGL